MLAIWRTPLGKAWLAIFALCLLFNCVMSPYAAAAELEKETALPSLFSADLEANLNPQAEETSCRVEYTTKAAFDLSGWSGALIAPCSPQTLGAVDPAQQVTATLSDLAINTKYVYRFVATTTVEEKQGSGGEFQTFGVEEFSFETITNALGGKEQDSAAGSHPYELVTKITLPHGVIRNSNGAAALAKDVLAELPPGLIGNPTAVPQCPVRLAEERRCSGDSQVGLVKVFSAGQLPLNSFPGQLFNVSPATGEPARLAGQVNISTNAYIGASLRSGEDYGITSGATNLPTLTNPYFFEIRLWGVPADSSHDGARVCGGAKPEQTTSPCSVTPGLPLKPFLRNPTQCAGPLQARVKVDSYQLPGTFFSKAFQMPAITECEKLKFEPTLALAPTTSLADSPTGLDVDLHVPQNEDRNELATPDLRDAVVTLPPGLTVNPSSASGLASCTPAQIGLTTPVGTTPIHTTPDPAQCPEAAKVGTVEVDTPLLDHPLFGAVYIATPYENPFNSLLAIYIAVADPQSGVVLKLAGHVEIGPEGQLTTTFSENPQLPFEDFKLDFFGGPRSALKTPALCGSYSTASSLTPWSAPQSGPSATPAPEPFHITAHPSGGPCPTTPSQQPNHPAFEAGSESPIAGAYSPFIVRLAREDGSQQFASLTVTPPPGLLGRLTGIPYCPDAALAAAATKTGAQEIAAPSCSAASEVGIVNVGAGAGPSPYYVQGKAYLAGPYKGAPLSLAIITPAVAGPYDLGTVVVRSAIEVDPFTAQITVKSDPIPTELKGIPLDVRSIAVKMSRPNFTLNPTSCEAKSATANLTSTLGQTAALSNRFQVGECGKLKFAPKLKLTLSGKTKRSGHPALKAVLTYPKGAYANIARAQVGLPHAEFLDQGNLDKVCTQPDLKAGTCPKTSIYGHAKAWTPLLEKPLEGPVYLGVGFGYKLPALVADLNGQIRVLLKSKVDTTKHEGIRSTFEAVPDAPVSRFVLEMKGGPKYGLLENSENVCLKTQKASARFVAQNGLVQQSQPVIGNDCKTKGKGRAKKPQGR